VLSNGLTIHATHSEKKGTHDHTESYTAAAERAVTAAKRSAEMTKPGGCRGVPTAAVLINQEFGQK
jgi:hypothetical protein